MEENNMAYHATETTSSEEFASVLSKTKRLIMEVRKRPLLWDRKHDYYNSRLATDREWLTISEIMGERKVFLRQKWKNLRDQFQKELKRVSFPLKDDTDKSYVANYSGKWIHFGALLYLKDSMTPRQTAGSFYNILEEIDVNHQTSSIEEVSQKDDEEEEGDEEYEESEHEIKEEFIEFEEESILGYDTGASTTLNLQAQEAMPSKGSTVKTPKEKNSGVCIKIEQKEECDLKRKGSDSFWKEEYHERIKCRKLSPVDDSEENDGDLHFFKSLLPYMRSLNPIKKLLVRNEIQTLLIKENLCDKCKGHSCDK